MSWPQQYPYQQPMPQVQQPFQKRRLDFVDGDAGMRSFYVGPGEVVPLFDMGSATLWLKSANEAGVPSTVRYRLVEEDESMAGSAVEERLAAMEESINQLKEAMNANSVPDVRPVGQPRHAGGGAGAAGGQQGWQPGGSAAAADGE